MILVTGGRDYRDRETVYAELDAIGPGLVIEGGCRHSIGTRAGHPVLAGADFYTSEWARERGVHSLRCDALWGAYSNAAGPKRNAVMVEVCKRLGGSVVAFPGGSGTADCVRRAKAAGLAVRLVG